MVYQYKILTDAMGRLMAMGQSTAEKREDRPSELKGLGFRVKALVLRVRL